MIKNNELSSYIDIKNSVFNNNKARAFGGAICSSLKNYYFTNTKFEDNKADVAGGVLFLNNEIINEKDIITINRDNVFVNKNTAKSYGNEYASYPSQVILQKGTYNVTIYSGGAIFLSFKVIDYFGSKVMDISRYFDDLSLLIEVTPELRNDTYFLQGNKNLFINGNTFIQYNNY